MLAAKGLYKFYGSVPAVQNVTFTLEPGQVLGYLGPNGSGKSTTVKMLTGLLEPTDGEVTHNGQNIHKDLAAYRKRLGYVPEPISIPISPAWSISTWSERCAPCSSHARAPESIPSSNSSPSGRIATSRSALIPKACASAFFSSPLSWTIPVCSSWTSRSPASTSLPP